MLTYTSQLLPSTHGEDLRYHKREDATPVERTTNTNHDGGIPMRIVYDRELRSPKVPDPRKHRHVYISDVSVI